MRNKAKIATVLTGIFVSTLVFPSFGKSFIGEVKATTQGIKVANSYEKTTVKPELITPYGKVDVNVSDAIYSQMRKAWFNDLIGEGYDLKDPRIKEIITKADVAAQKQWDALDKNSSRTKLWSDITRPKDYLTSPEGSAEMLTLYRRIEALSKAYATVGSKFKGNEELYKDIEEALDWMYDNRYNENTQMYSNWWNWEIGVPQSLNNITILLYDRLPKEKREKYMKVSYYFQPDPYKSGARDCNPSNVNRVSEAANRIDIAKVSAVRGALLNDSKDITNARDCLSDTFLYVKNKDGLYKDGSFVQHDTVPYAGSYGGVFINGISTLLMILSNTPFEVKDPNIKNVYDSIENTFEPLLYKGAVMDMVNGRSICRGDATQANGKQILNGILTMSQFAPEPYATKFKSMVKSAILDNTYRDYFSATGNIRLLTLAKNVINDSSIKAKEPLVLNKVFANMDRVVHRTPEYAFGISMYSNRITNFECMNNENKRGWHTADGMTYLYNKELAYYSDDFWPTVNPYRLPGTTVDTEAKVDGKGMKVLSSKSFVGGTTMENKYGVTGMELEGVKNGLTAKKSWFMFENEVVALGAGINSTSGRTIESIVDNRKIKDTGDNVFTINGEVKNSSIGWSADLNKVKWAHIQGNVTGSDIGYYFPGDANIKALREKREGKWSDIGPGSKELLNKNYLTMVLDHGTNPVDATYAYVILPNKTANEVKTYAENPSFSILSNTKDIQAVKNRKLNILGANFWNDGKNTVDLVSVDKKSSVMVKEGGDYIEVSIADPTMENKGVINVEVDKPQGKVMVKDDNITVDGKSNKIKFSVNVKDAKGKTFTIKFSK